MRLPLLWLIGIACLFILGGGLTTLAVAPRDAVLHDTYYVVPHFHLVLPVGFAFLVFAAFYFWAPKLVGRRYSARLGALHFGLTVLGACLISAPLLLNLRLVAEPESLAIWNRLSMAGYAALAASLLVFFAVLAEMFLRPKP